MKGSSVKQELNYGYDRASNRTWRRNELAHTLSNGEENKHDNLYGYDGLYQVIEPPARRPDGYRPEFFGNHQQDEDWCYDETGNWQRYGNEAQSNLEQFAPTTRPTRSARWPIRGEWCSLRTIRGGLAGEGDGGVVGDRFRVERTRADLGRPARRV